MASPGIRLHLLPYAVADIRSSLSRKNLWKSQSWNAPTLRHPIDVAAMTRDHYYDPHKLLETDNRIEAFRRFSAAKGISTATLPDIYANAELDDITSQPLLNYFLLTSGSSETKSANVAVIYASLFKRLQDRNRNVSKLPENTGKPGAGLDQQLFDRVFETMAVAAWRTGGARAASWKEVLSEAEREDSYLQPGEDGLSDVFQSYMPSRAAQQPFRLAAAFYMRNDKATGIEFTHRSFCDYLYSRRLAKALDMMVQGLMVAPAVEPEMLRRWGALTESRRMTHEVMRFLALEIKATIPLEVQRKWHSVLASTVERALEDGLDVRGSTVRRREVHASHVEEALFVAWRCLWPGDVEGRYWKVGRNTGELLRRTLYRHEGIHGVGYPSVFIRSLSGADLGGVDWSGLKLAAADLSHVNLRDGMLMRVNLEGANLEGADLSTCYIGYGNLSYANLRNANMESAYLGEAELRSANIEGANLRKANIGGANLESRHVELNSLKSIILERTYRERSGCSIQYPVSILFGSTVLKGANLESAYLCDSNLRGVDLSEARLKWVNLERADLSRANLENADLSDAKLDGSRLHRTKLVGANVKFVNVERIDLKDAELCGVDWEGVVLIEANLSGVMLNGANLGGATLRGSNLSGANLEGTNLEGADLSGVDLSRARMGCTNLEGANLEGAQLLEVSLGKANCKRAEFVRANLCGVNFRDANLEAARLEFANAARAEFCGANLTFAVLRSANLSFAAFNDANLQGADLELANVGSVDLSGANLSGVSFEGVVVSGVSYAEMKLRMED